MKKQPLPVQPAELLTTEAPETEKVQSTELLIPEVTAIEKVHSSGLLEPAIITDKKQLFNDLDQSITTGIKAIEFGFYSLAAGFSKMNESKAWEASGYKSLADYAQEKHGIGKVQMYNYINAYKAFGEQLRNNQSLGVTRAAALASLPDSQLELLLNEGTIEFDNGESVNLKDIESMAVRKLESEIRKLNLKNKLLEGKQNNSALLSEQLHSANLELKQYKHENMMLAKFKKKHQREADLEEEFDMFMTEALDSIVMGFRMLNKINQDPDKLSAEQKVKVNSFFETLNLLHERNTYNYSAILLSAKEG